MSVSPELRERIMADTTMGMFRGMDLPPSILRAAEIAVEWVIADLSGRSGFPDDGDEIWDVVREEWKESKS